jgi:hypothetical protein
MTTKEELIAQCKAENPTMVSVINGENIELIGADYDKACNDWAEMRLAQITLENETNAARAAAEAKLAALGLTADDLKALGLGNN